MRCTHDTNTRAHIRIPLTVSAVVARAQWPKAIASAATVIESRTSEVAFLCLCLCLHSYRQRWRTAVLLPLMNSPTKVLGGAGSHRSGRCQGPEPIVLKSLSCYGCKQISDVHRPCRRHNYRIVSFWCIRHCEISSSSNYGQFFASSLACI